LILNPVESVLLVNAYLLEVMAEYAKVVDADRCSALSTHVPRPLSSRWAADYLCLVGNIYCFRISTYFLYERRSSILWQKWLMWRWCIAVWQV